MTVCCLLVPCGCNHKSRDHRAFARSRSQLSMRPGCPAPLWLENARLGYFLVTITSPRLTMGARDMVPVWQLCAQQNQSGLPLCTILQQQFRLALGVCHCQAPCSVARRSARPQNVMARCEGQREQSRGTCLDSESCTITKIYGVFLTTSWTESS